MGTPRRRPWSVPDTLVAVAFTILAALIYSGLWSDLDRSYLIAGGSDQILWEWLFTVAAEAVRQGENPLFTDLQNAPSGVNLMANTAVLGLALPLAPITWAWGATVTYALALTGSLAASAVAWYWVFSRHLVTHRVPAVVGATACTFAPGVISHGQAHVNFVAWFVLPFITLAMVRIVRGARPVRDGVGLGLLASYQILLGEELLLVFGVMLLVAGVAVLAPRGRALVGAVRPAAVGFGVGTAVVLVAVGYPLWFQFAGPQSYTGLALGLAGNDTAAFTRFATQSVAGVPSAIAEVTLNRTEENASFGWPLIVMVLVVSVWLWREPLPRALAITAATMAWLSTGATLVVAGEDTGVPGPWVLLGTLPLFDSVLVSRMALGCLPVVGALLALATQRVLDATPSAPEASAGVPTVPVRLLWAGALVAVLLPLAPTALPVVARPTVPALFTEGTWRQYVAPGATLVTVPLPSPSETEPLRWQVAAGTGFRLPAGYFVGPTSEKDRRGRYGTALRPTAALFEEVRRTGRPHPVRPLDRLLFRDDMTYWGATVLVLAPGRANRALQRTADELTGVPSRVVDGVRLWDLRAAP